MQPEENSHGCVSLYGAPPPPVEVVQQPLWRAGERLQGCKEFVQIFIGVLQTPGLPVDTRTTCIVLTATRNCAT